MIVSASMGGAVAVRKRADPESLIVAEALAVIQARACRGLGVQQLAEVLGVSRRWLAKWFPAIVGCPPHEAIRRAVFSRVEMLLLETDLTIPEIARETGFKHHEYLAAAFRGRYGVPPGRWRRQPHPASIIGRSARGRKPSR